jgi:hypothetical protein
LWGSPLSYGVWIAKVNEAVIGTFKRMFFGRLWCRALGCRSPLPSRDIGGKMRYNIVLQFKFEPKIFFEENFAVSNYDYEIKIKEGLVEVLVENDTGTMDSKEIEYFQQVVKEIFWGVQLVAKSPFKLSTPVQKTIAPDGSVTSRAIVNDGLRQYVGGQADLEYTGPDGRRINTRTIRVDKKRKLAKLTNDYSGDATLLLMMNNFDAALVSPKVEFNYLYAIKEIINTRFGGNANAAKAINMTKDEFKDLGKIANDSTIRQGRHHGKGGTNLRDASEDEKAKIRQLSSKIIEKYLYYLEQDEGM